MTYVELLLDVEKNQKNLADELYEVVKEYPEFKAMGMDEQGEFILHLISELNKDIESAIAMVSGK